MRLVDSIPDHFAAARTPARVQPKASVVAWVLVFGIFFCWIAAVLRLEQSTVVDGSEDSVILISESSAAYYVANAAGLASFFLAGALALTARNRQIVGYPVRAAFYVIGATSILWLAASYSPRELLTSKPLGATGPFIWLSLVVVFAGIDVRVWRYVGGAARIIAFLTGALAARALLAETSYEPFHGFSKYIGYAILLTWFGGWTIISGATSRGRRLAINCLLYVIMLWNAVYSQSRSWLIITLLIGLIAARARFRSQSHRQRVATAMVVLGMLAGISVGVWTLRPESTGTALDRLIGRAADDTRSGQYVDFFEDVSPSELILGRGPNGTWYWPDVGPYQYFDNGFLWMLFVGGLPILIPYVLIVVVPGLRAFRAKPRGEDAAAVALVLIWALALTGFSTFALPSLTAPPLFVSLLVGRCYALLADRRQLAAAESRARWSAPFVEYPSFEKV